MVLGQYTAKGMFLSIDRMNVLSTETSEGNLKIEGHVCNVQGGGSFCDTATMSTYVLSRYSTF